MAFPAADDSVKGHGSPQKPIEEEEEDDQKEPKAEQKSDSSDGGAAGDSDDGPLVISFALFILGLDCFSIL